MSYNSKDRDSLASRQGIKLSGGCCVVCGWGNRDSWRSKLVEGAHVRPHRSGSEYDIPSNIIGLCPNHHAEYDAYLFYIEPKTRKLHYRSGTGRYHGKNISQSIQHIKEQYIVYNKHQYDLHWRGKTN